MRYSASEKAEIIRFLEQSHLPAKQTLAKLGIPRTTFYRWYDLFRLGGIDALEDHSPLPGHVWNRVPDNIRQEIVSLALEEPTLSPRELAVKFTDDKRYFVSESSVYQAPRRKSFVLALKDAPEIWEIATSPDAVPFHEGFVHSHEVSIEESLAAEKGLFARRRIMVNAPLDDFFFTPDYRNLIGTNREGDAGVVVNLDVGREIAQLPLPGMPHLGSGITWESQGKRVMATPHLKEGVLSVIDIDKWTRVKTIKMDGPGFFLRSHHNSPYVWAYVFFGPHKDEMHIIDKQTLEIIKTLNPAPGKTVAHTELTRDGRHALVSVWEQDGALIVYDAKTLEEVKRLPMRKPSGKYNVWNKINFKDGTSH
jgi:transposase-like protein